MGEVKHITAARMKRQGAAAFNREPLVAIEWDPTNERYADGERIGCWYVWDERIDPVSGLRRRITPYARQLTIEKALHYASELMEEAVAEHHRAEMRSMPGDQPEP